MQLKLGLFSLSLIAAVSAAPVDKQANVEVPCKPLYDGTLVLDMRKPTEEHGTRISADKVDPYDRKMILFDEGAKGSVRVTFAECMTPGLPDKADPNEAYGRLELKDAPGTCITHVPGERENQVALGLAPCRSHKGKKQKQQWFSSWWTGDYTRPASLVAMDPDTKTFYSQWRIEKHHKQQVLTMTSDHVKFSHFNDLHLIDVA